MSNPLFSVIIPLYNKEESIAWTVNSVLNQTFADFELIVVNDGSEDNSSGMIQDYSDPRIRLINQENGGVSNARNRGIREAKGTYICFLDADDLWEPNFLGTVKSLIDEFPEARVFCPSYQVAYGARIVHPKWRSVDLKKNSLVTDFFEMATATFWICNSSCIAVAAQKLWKMDYWFPEGETVYEDFDLWLRLGASCKVAHSNTICSTYQRRTKRNARQAHLNKIIYSKSYMDTLNGFLADSKLTCQQKLWINEIRDRRMVVYIFSLLTSHNRNKAIEELKRWKPTGVYKKYAFVLKGMTFIPYAVIDVVQQIRYKVF